MTPTQNTFGPLYFFWALLFQLPLKGLGLNPSILPFRCPQIQECVKMGMTAKLKTLIPFGPSLPSVRNLYKASMMQSII